MPQITSIKPWNSTSFTGTRLTIANSPLTASEIKNLELTHGVVCEVTEEADQIEVLLVDNEPNVSDKTVDDLMRALRHA